jgi:hypothetical protein
MIFPASKMCNYSVRGILFSSSYVNHWPLPSPDGSNQMVCPGTNIPMLQVTMKVTDPMFTYCIQDDSGN